MCNRLTVFILILLTTFVTFANAVAQEQCASFVEEALIRVDEMCTDISRNTLCYGNNTVRISPWTDEEFEFEAPGDVISVDLVQSILASQYDSEADEWGVALMRVQANIPNTLPGQAVTFLLMGSTELRNEISPEEVVEIIEITATTTVASNLRSRPADDAFVRRSVPAGTELILIGQNTNGDWYEISTQTGERSWIFANIVQVDADEVNRLPVTFGSDNPPLYQPMQAVYFTTGIGNAECKAAPDALVISGPSDFQLRLKINDLEIQLGSELIAFETQLTNNDRAVALALTQGKLETQVGVTPIRILSSQSNLAVLVITTDSNGVVTPSSRLALPSEVNIQDIRERILNACEYSDATVFINCAEVIDSEEEGTDATEISIYEPPLLPTQTPLPTSTSIPATAVPPVSAPDGYGSIVPNDRLTVQSLEESERNRAHLLSVSFIMIVLSVSAFGIVEERRNRDSQDRQD